MYKQTGQYDRNCANTEGLDWNAVFIRHSDGSVAWYGHLKNATITTKNVGQTVAQGEFLGFVGSSGKGERGKGRVMSTFVSCQDVLDDIIFI